MSEAFAAVQKLLTFFRQKIMFISDTCINIWNFNETLTNDVFTFEQPGPYESTEIELLIVVILMSALSWVGKGGTL